MANRNRDIGILISPGEAQMFQRALGGCIFGKAVRPPGILKDGQGPATGLVSCIN
jgi:hypothetical protein